MKRNLKHNVCAAENQCQFWGKHTKAYSIYGYVAEVAMWTQRIWMMDLNMKTSMSMWRMVERWQSGWRWRWNSVSPQVHAAFRAKRAIELGMNQTQTLANPSEKSDQCNFKWSSQWQHLLAHYFVLMVGHQPGSTKFLNLASVDSGGFHVSCRL